MKLRKLAFAMLFIGGAAISAQVVPATNGPTGLPASGTLHYDLRYSQAAQFYGENLGNVQSSAASGELTYANLSESRPLSLTYSGGDRWNISGGSSGTGVFQHLLVSQGVLGRNWALSLRDDLSYMPQAPTTGFSGIPGVGGLPGQPDQPSQPILTLNTRSIYNTLNPSFTHSLDHATSLGINGSYGILRFPHGDGLEMNQWQLSPQVSRRLNGLNSISGEYAFSRFSYPGFAITMETHSAKFGCQRAWNRRLKTSAFAGPQWIRGSDSLKIPSSINLAVNANATYETSVTSANLSYSQAATGGAGVATTIGVHNQDLRAVLSRQFGRTLSLGANGAFMRTQGLHQSGVTNGKFGGVTATKRLGRYVIVFANYSAIQQSSSSALPTNAIRGLSHVVGFGIGYSPREMHFKK